MCQYYSNGAKPVYLVLLDASKAFDKVSFYTLFNMLLDKKMCLRTVKLLHYMQGRRGRLGTRETWTSPSILFNY